MDGTSALGFRVKSGWAIAVLLAGPARSPRVADTRVVQLGDPADPKARQPYHGGTGKEERDAAKIARRVAAVERYAGKSLAALIAEYRAAGHRPRGVGIVAGSDGDPARIANPHIRAHASEGKLFRTVIEDGARQAKLPCLLVVERALHDTAAKALGRKVPDLKRAVTALGDSLDGSWRAEHKAAALAAWMVLSSRA
jgi:hypothetical protein